VDLIKLLEARFDKVDEKLTRVEAIETKVSNLEILLTSLTIENKELRTEMKKKDKQLEDVQKTINSQEVRLNKLDQHHRSWAARVLNVPLTTEEGARPTCGNTESVRHSNAPYSLWCQKCQQVEADQLLEVAHTLPGKPGENKTIIMRFYNRNMKTVIFRNKSDLAPRINRRTSGGGGRESSGTPAGMEESGDPRGRYCFPLYEDMTRANLNKMKAIAVDSRAQSCWSWNGSIRYKLVGLETVRKVNSIPDPLDVILSNY
jgi:hypothetical protein